MKTRTSHLLAAGILLFTLAASMTGCAIVDESSGSEELSLTTEGRYGGEGIVANLPPELGDGYLNQYGMETIQRDEKGVRCGDIPLEGEPVPVCQFFKDGNTMVVTGLPVESLTVVEGRRDLIGTAGIIPRQDGAQAAGA